MNKIIWDDAEKIYNRVGMWDAFKDKKVLVTGANGMLPSYLIYSLIYANEYSEKQNTQILALCRNRTKAEAMFGEFLGKDYFRLIIADVNEPLNFDTKIDFIIHGASLASSQYYGIDPVGILKPNIIGTINLLEIAREQGVEGFLFFSSGEIYGEITGKDIITETDGGRIDPIDIRSCYAESKRMGENMCKSWQHQYGVPAKIARIFHTYGPTMDIVNDKRVFAEFTSDIVNNRNIRMKSDGSAIRPFCYISDATVAFFLLLLKGKAGEAYNVSNNDCSISIRELADILVNIFPEKNLKVIQCNREENENYIENKSANKLQIDTTKLKKLGWEPEYSIYKGFKRTIESFMS